MQSSLILKRCCISLQTWACLIWHFICLKYDSIFNYLLLKLFDGLCKALNGEQTMTPSVPKPHCFCLSSSCSLTQALSDQTEKMQTDVLHCCFSILNVESNAASKFTKTLLWSCFLVLKYNMGPLMMFNVVSQPLLSEQTSQHEFRDDHVSVKHRTQAEVPWMWFKSSLKRRRRQLINLWSPAVMKGKSSVWYVL